MNTKIFFLAIFISFSSYAQVVPPELAPGSLFCTSEGENLNQSGWVQVKMKILIDSTSKDYNVEMHSLLGFGGYECTDFCEGMMTDKMPYLIPLQFASPVEDWKTGKIFHLFQTQTMAPHKLFVTLTKQDDGSLFSWTGYGDYPIGWYTPLRCHYL